MNKLDIKFIENKNLKSKPLEAPVFGSFYTNYIFEMDYDLENGWHNPVIKPFENFSLSPAALCLHYGQTIFEGLKAIKVNDEIVLFRPLDNFKRMNESAKRMVMPTIDVDFALAALVDLLKVDNDWFYDLPGSSVYIRPSMIATQESLNVVVSNKYKFFIMLTPSAPYLTKGNVSLITESNYMRVATKGTGEAKNGGNYGGSYIASQEASKNGFSQVLWLDPHESKYIEEAGSMNIFFVIDGKLYTPKTNGSILKGITRDSIIKIAPDLGLEVIETTISIDEIIELYKNGSLTEAFSSGTAASVTPINQITHNGFDMIFNENKTSTEIYNYLEDLKKGIIEDKYNFIVKI